mgnify:CR=1 FL=1
MEKNVKEYFISADLTPGQVLAGDSITITIRLVIGKDFISEKSRIVFDMPGTLKYSRPTCYLPSEDGYTEVYCSNPDVVYSRKVWDIATEDFAKKCAVQGMGGRTQRMFVIDIEDGKLSAGDEIIVKWGDVVNGFGVGTKVVSTLTFPDFHDTVHVRYFINRDTAFPDLARDFKGYERPVPDAEIPLDIEILPREPVSLRLLRRTKKAYLQILDRFANICRTDSLDGFLQGNLAAVKNTSGVYEFNAPHISVVSNSLPLSQSPALNDVFDSMHIYFGDMHTHSSISNDCADRQKSNSTPERHFTYARDVAALDFAALTDHHQPWDSERNKIGEKNWEIICSTAKRFTAAGEFIAFPGFEYRCPRGDTAIVLNEDISYAEIDDPSLKDIRTLWEKFKGRDYLSIPHFHNTGSLPVNEWYRCPDERIEPVLEINSCHGSYEREGALETGLSTSKPFRSDRCGNYFLQNGYPCGFVCNSDGHIGNPGNNGLTAVFARELTREAIFEAIRNRHVYGTTNARIRLLFTMNGSLMGSRLTAVDEKKLSISLSGESKFKAVDIFRNGVLFRRFKPYAVDFQETMTIRDAGKSSWYVRAIQMDNHVAYASPIWFT